VKYERYEVGTKINLQIWRSAQICTHLWGKLDFTTWLELEPLTSRAEVHHAKHWRGNPINSFFISVIPTLTTPLPFHVRSNTSLSPSIPSNTSPHQIPPLQPRLCIFFQLEVRNEMNLFQLDKCREHSLIVC
jgi:hypothetical protein